MRSALLILVLMGVTGIAWVGWLMTREPNEAQGSRIARVLQSTSPASEPPAYAHCASCHLHDGSGRPDGSIPRLAGQRRLVLEKKLQRIRTGAVRLPVMEPFARTLAPDEIEKIAEYLSALPSASSSPGNVTEEARTRGASLYSQDCAACHGANGEGHDGLFASRLCGQYAGYMNRRLDEIAAHSRDDADAIMQDAIDEVPTDDLRAIVAWLAAGEGCSSP